MRRPLFDLPDGFVGPRLGSLARTVPRLFLRIAGVLEPTVKKRRPADAVGQMFHLGGDAGCPAAAVERSQKTHGFFRR